MANQQFISSLVIAVAVFMLLPSCITDLDEHERANGNGEALARLGPNSAKTEAAEFLNVDLAGMQREAFRAYRRGEYEQAIGVFLEILSHDVNNENAIYDVAACYGRLGEAELAAQYLDAAAEAGYDDFFYLAEREDFEPVRGNLVFDEVESRLIADHEKRIAGKGSLFYVETPRLLQCRLRLPADYDQERAYPLVVGLHGYGSSHNEFVSIWDKLDHELDFIFAAPQAPYPLLMNDDVGYSWSIYEEGEPKLFERSYELGETYILNTVSALKKDYKISDVYLMGFSQGCTMAYIIGIWNPRMFKGMIGFGGRLEADWFKAEQLKAISGMRIFIAQGAEDRLTWTELAQKTKDIFQDQGCQVTYYEFAGGHEVPADALELARKWLLQE